MNINKYCAIGDAIVDNSIFVDDIEYKNRLNLTEATITSKKMKISLDGFSEESAKKLSKEKNLTAGGSIANSIYILSSLGDECSFIGNAGNDEYGRMFCKDFKNRNIAVTSNFINNDAETGVCYVFVTPDAERDMYTYLGDCSKITIQKEEEQLVKKSDAVLFEMYLVATDSGYNATKEVLEIAKKNGQKIIATTSAKFLINGYRDRVDEFLAISDIVFCNDEEGMALAGVTDEESMINYFKGKKDGKEYIVTLGNKGAVSIQNGEAVFQGAFKVDAIDTTGAGDTFLGTYLYARGSGLNKEKSLKKACYLCSKIVCQFGARLQGNVKEIYNEVD